MDDVDLGVDEYAEKAAGSEPPAGLDVEDVLAKVVLKHQQTVNWRDGRKHCMLPCKWTSSPVAPGTYAVDELATPMLAAEEFRAHFVTEAAAALAPWVAQRDAQQRAEALREAADRMPAFHDNDEPEWAITSACKWLRARADRIAPTTERRED